MQSCVVLPRKSALRLILCTLGFALSSSALADTIVQSINADKNPSTDTFYASEAGWLYTPSQTFDLTAIATRFASTDGRTVSIELYTGLPASGGTLLGSTDFIPASNVFSKASFASSLHLDAGQDYFVGFRNISGLGSNITFDSGKTSLGPAYISSGGNSLYTSLCLPSSSPILEFFTDSNPPATPLPATSVTGIALLGILALRRPRATPTF